MEYAMDFAKHTAKLDFVAITDHSRLDGKDDDLTEEEWAQIVELNTLHNLPGEFVTLNGYEWNQNPGGTYGHKNVWRKEYDIVEDELVETDINYLGFTPSLFLKIVF